MIDRASQLTREYNDADQMDLQGALPTENAPAATGNAVIGALPAELAPAMAAGEGTSALGSAATGALPVEVAPSVAAPHVEPAAPAAAPVAAPVAPVAAYQAPTARETRDGVGRDGQVAALSQTQGYGMVPVYQAQQGRGADRGPPVLMGYEFNPLAAGLTTVDTPKPAAILAEEKRIGKPMEATYATYTAPRGQGGESVAYGPPTGYRYDNGQSQYVKFDSSGNYYETEQRKGEFDDALKMAALFAAIATGGASLGLGEGASTAALGAGQVGAAAPSLNQLAAAGMGPGSYGALNLPTLQAAVAAGSIAPEALAAAQLAATGTTGAGFASLAPVAAKSLNEGIASGTFTPGSAGADLASKGLLTGEKLAAAQGLVTAGATPALVEMATKGAQDYINSGGSQLSGTSGPNGTDIFREVSKNQAVASGMSPGSMGADLASKGLLTAGQLAAAYGVVTDGSLLSNVSDLLSKKSGTSSNTSNTSNTYISGGTTGGSSNGPWNSYLTPQVSRIGAIQPAAMANPLAGLISPIATNYTPSSSMLDRLNRNNFAKGGEVVKADLSKFEPEFVDIIKKRSGGSPDHHHPNYNGNQLFRTGGAGKHVQGPGTGQSDDIPAMLADGEYVFDADTVSALGDGSNKAGASALDQMRKAIRKHKRGAPIDKIPPKAKNPLEYLRGK